MIPRHLSLPSKAYQPLAYPRFLLPEECPVSLLFDFLAHSWPQFLDQSLIHQITNARSFPFRLHLRRRYQSKLLATIFSLALIGFQKVTIQAKFPKKITFGSCQPKD